MPAQANDQLVPLPFPLLGIDSAGPADSQPPMTCRDAENVRAVEPRSLRARGGSRPGLSQYIRQSLPLPEDQAT